MHRIDSFGTSASLPSIEAPTTSPGYFTKGNPGLAVPATLVSQDWLNSVQEELANVIEAAGLTLAKGTNNQLLAALLGISLDYSEPQFTIANNQSSFANITGLVFDKTIYRSAIISYSAYRKDAGQEVAINGKLHAIYKTVANAWEIFGPELVGDLTNDIGMEFDITSAGQVRYKSSNFAGGSYVGLMRFKVDRFKL